MSSVHIAKWLFRPAVTVSSAVWLSIYDIFHSHQYLLFICFFTDGPHIDLLLLDINCFSSRMSHLFCFCYVIFDYVTEKALFYAIYSPFIMLAHLMGLFLKHQSKIFARCSC